MGACAGGHGGTSVAHPRACAAACGVAANFFCIEQSCLKRRAEKDHETDVKLQALSQLV